MSKSYNCINISYTKIQNKTTTVVVFTVSHTYSPESHLHIQKNYHRSGVHQHLYAYTESHLYIYISNTKHQRLRKQCGEHLSLSWPVATPKPGLTQMASPNRNPGTPCLILLFYVLLNFLFQNCRNPNPRPDPNDESEPEPGLLRRFHLSYQNILLIHLVAEAVSVLGKPMIITNSKQFGRPMNINKIHVQRKAFHALFKMIYKNQVSGFNPFVYKTPLVQKMICKILEYTLIRRTLSMTLRCVILAFFPLLTRSLRIVKTTR